MKQMNKLSKIVQHPTSAHDKDYLRFNISEGGDITNIDEPFMKIRLSKPLEQGLLLFLNTESLIELSCRDMFSAEEVDSMNHEFYMKNKRFYEGDFKVNYHVPNGEDFSEGKSIESLDIIKCFPAGSFKAEKLFYKNISKMTIWLVRHGFSARNQFIGGGAPTGWDECIDVDKSLEKIIRDFNRMDFAYTNHFSCSGLYEDHNGHRPYRTYGFIRFKHKNSEQYLEFEKEINSIEGLKIQRGEVGLELVVGFLKKSINGTSILYVPPKKGHDFYLKKKWNKAHEIIKKHVK